MAFSLSLGGFFEFIFRPLTNPVGFIMLVGAIIWIVLRIKGKVRNPLDKNKRGGQNYQVDYVIK